MISNIKKRVQRRTWPLKRRLAAAARCRVQKPWLFSTGPKTAAGKAVSRYNAVTHGATAAHWRRLVRALRKQRDFINKINLMMEEERRMQGRSSAPQPCAGLGAG